MDSFFRRETGDVEYKDAAVCRRQMTTCAALILKDSIACCRKSRCSCAQELGDGVSRSRWTSRPGWEQLIRTCALNEFVNRGRAAGISVQV